MKYHSTIKKSLFAVLAAATLLLIPLSAQAQFGGNPGAPGAGLDDLQSASGSTLPQPVSINNRSDVINLIALVISWALYLSGAVAVVFVIIGGYRYLTAGGNEETATKGRKAVVNAIIGLVIIILAYVIINVVTNFLTS